MPKTTLTESAVDLYCSFWLGDHCFGVPSTAVREFHAAAPLTPVPGAPSAIRGYVNLRGQLFLVLDPSALLLGSPGSASQSAELIVFRPEVGEAFAISVGQVGEMLPIAQAQIHVPKARTDDVDLSVAARRSERLIVGHATLDSLLVTLVEPQRLLPAAFADAARG